MKVPMKGRVIAAAGAVVLWAYARACRERNATQRRLARANLLRRVTARPSRCHDCGRADGGCDRVITVDIPAEDRDPIVPGVLREIGAGR